MTKRNYFLEVVDSKNHTTVYLFSSANRKGTLGHKLDCIEAINGKIGYIPQYNEDSVYLDNSKNRIEQCVEENETTSIIDCR